MMRLGYSTISVLWLLSLAVRAAAAPASSEAPVPQISFDGPALRFDLANVEVGVAEYEAGPTGTTVLYFPKSVKAAVDVRGGGPGTVDTDILRLAYDSALVHAISLSGGSAYGLSAATGVANAIKDETLNAGNWNRIAVVPGAIIFDLAPRRYNVITPDDRLGRAAFTNRRPGWIPLGARGAGRFAMQGSFFGPIQHSGQGAAFRQVGNVKVLVVTVVNAFGTIVDRNGHVIRCAQATNGDCGRIEDWLRDHIAQGQPGTASAAAAPTSALTANTTITIVVTNQALPFAALQRLAVQVHNSMSRAIQPFGTEVDGDTLFAVTTAEVDEGALNHIDLGALASETAWDAILASAPQLPPVAPRSNVRASSEELAKFTGRYAFAPGVVAEIRRHHAALEIDVSGNDSLYLKAGQPVALTAVGADEFELAGVRGDRLHIDRDGRGQVTGFTLNPGPWPIVAKRLP